MTIYLTIPELALFCIGALLLGAIIGLFIYCRLCRRASPYPDDSSDFGDPWWPS